MRYSLYILMILLISCIEQSKKYNQESIVEPPSAIGSPEDPRLRYEFEMSQVVDPTTGSLPKNIHHHEKAFQKKLLKQNRSLRRANNLNWDLAGPYNVGGRTRALALDIRDEETIMAGGVSGGMWKSTDGGESWVRTSATDAYNGVTCIAQDLSVGYNDVWYYGTGELEGNSARIAQTPYRGDGIFKSTDNGESWDVLTSTSFEQYSVFESPFNYTWNIEVLPSDEGEGIVFAAIYGSIVKSEDGGETWETVLGRDLINANFEDLNNTGSAFYTNVMNTPNSGMYATLSTTLIQNNGVNFLQISEDSVVVLSQDTLFTEGRGIFHSDDGVVWEDITPSGLGQHDRIVMSYAPSDEDIVYFMASRNDIVNLWRYDHGSWSLRNAGLPDGDQVASLNIQGSYNMIIKVHPEDPDVVYLGGTNLYRSTDGFSTLDNTDHIGGYDPESSNSIYNGHHPDQHEIVFLPSDANVMFSGNDGGVRKTLDNLAGDVSWSSLNNGFVTSQFYTVALSKEFGSNEMVGGMQDNGTYFKPSFGNVSWDRLIGGDGSFCASTRDDVFWYISFQNGQVFRVTLNNNAGLSSFAQVDPEGGGGYLFINPFILDPNNYNRMYLAGGDVIWRNDNLSQATRGVQTPSSINWTEIDASRIGVGTVSTLDVSTNPGDVLYFGTTQGDLYRLDDADGSFPELNFVFGQSGYVTSIGVDPLNADHFMFTYGNYNVPSIYLSSDGGSTVTDIGGNLEENEDGSGNGPSIRWCEIVPLADGTYKYFVGTSVGLYSTTLLNGASTVWIQEGVETIGNSVIRMMDYRAEDGRIAVATHGNGVFDTEIANPAAVESGTETDSGFTLITGYPNPFDEEFRISFSIPEDDRVIIYILNSLGERIKLLLDAYQYSGEVVSEWDGTNAAGTPVENGIYYYQIIYQSKVKAERIIKMQ